MNAPSRYGLTSPAGLEQGRFRIQRDRSGREIAINGAGNCAAVRPTAGRAGQARRAHAAAGEPGRQAPQGPIALDELTALIRAYSGNN